jgi:hypothetical protein
VDWYVLLLSPIVVLAVVLLLGFTGCQDLFGLDEVTVPGDLVFQVRVPANLTVDSQLFSYRQPNATSDEDAQMQYVVRTDEVGTFVFSYRINDAKTGSWTVKCHLNVHDASGPGEDSATARFVLMPNEGSTSTVLFETSADTTNFRVHVSAVPQ